MIKGSPAFKLLSGHLEATLANAPAVNVPGLPRHGPTRRAGH